jgi:hypothetical protein
MLQILIPLLTITCQLEVELESDEKVSKTLFSYGMVVAFKRVEQRNLTIDTFGKAWFLDWEIQALVDLLRALIHLLMILITGLLGRYWVWITMIVQYYILPGTRQTGNE